MTAEITCQGSGEFRLLVVTDRGQSIVTSPPPVQCSADAGGTSTRTRLGRAPANTSVSIEFDGDPGVLFLVRVQADRRL